jgi:hypothetical protein
MTDEKPAFELPPEPEESNFPWIGLGIGLAVILAVAAWWFTLTPGHQGPATAVTALEQQLTNDRLALDAERNKAVQMTQQLEAMKQDWATGKVADKHQAAIDYGQLEAARDAQRKKVKTLTDQYNEKVANLEKVQ